MPLARDPNTGLLGYFSIAAKPDKDDPAEPAGAQGKAKKTKESKECAEHRARILGDSVNRGALESAWKRSQVGDLSKTHEEGGLLGRVIDNGQEYAFRTAVGLLASVLGTIWVAIVYVWWQHKSITFVSTLGVANYEALNLPSLPHSLGLWGGATWFDVAVLLAAAALLAWQLSILVRSALQIARR